MIGDKRDAAWCIVDPGSELEDHTAWSKLTSDGRGTVFQEAFWYECWRRHFLRPSESLVLHQYKAANGLVASIPLIRRGRLVRKWRVLHNRHTPMVDLAFRGDADEVFGGFLEHVAAAGESVEFQALLKNGDACAALLEAAAKRRLPAIKHEAIGQSVVELDIGWGAFKERMSRNLVDNIERGERQLRRRGKLELREYGGGSDLDDVLADCFRLEASSWKGQAGTAISSRPDTLGFYKDLAAAAAKRRALALFTLSLDEQMIAFDYCLKWNMWIHCLKTGFDVRLSKYSPANVMRYLVLSREFDELRYRIYDMGIQSAWKERWTKTVMPLSSMTIYCDHCRARVAYLIGPGLRRILKRFSPLEKVVEHVRHVREKRKQLQRAEVKRRTVEQRKSKSPEAV